MAGNGVQTAEGLVHQHDGTVFHQCAHQRDTLALAARERRRQGPDSVLKPDFGQQPACAVEVRPFAAQTRAQHRIFQGVGPGQQKVALAHIGDRPGAHPARGRAVQPGDQPKEARLAHPARPEQAGPEPGFEADVQPVEQRRAAIGERGSAYIDGKLYVRCGPAHTLPPPVLTGSGSWGRPVGGTSQPR